MVLYSLHAYDTETYWGTDGDDHIADGILYTTFEKACSAMEKRIQEYMQERGRDEVFQPPNREKAKEQMKWERFVKYYRDYSGFLWVIQKWEICE